MDKPSRLKMKLKKDELKIRIKESRVRDSKFFSRQFSGSVTKQIKRISYTRPMKLINAISNLLSHVSARVYGSFLMTFGFVGIMMYLLRSDLPKPRPYLKEPE